MAAMMISISLSAALKPVFGTVVCVGDERGQANNMSSYQDKMACHTAQTCNLRIHVNVMREIILIFKNVI
jgi:hypothetical protein